MKEVIKRPYRLKNRVGEIHIIKNGYKIIITEYFGNRNCTIQFEDGNIVKNVMYESITNKCFENPYHRATYGVGYIGQGKYTRKNSLKAYGKWRGILQRCYDNEKRSEANSAYIGCTVHECWHNFQNFARWFEENYDHKIMQNWHLDKDLGCKGNKIYSSENCLLLPSKINLILGSSGKSRGECVVGVYKHKGKFVASCKVNGKPYIIGYYDSEIKAFEAYKPVKEKEMLRVINEYKDVLPITTYKRLINYKIEITD